MKKIKLEVITSGELPGDEMISRLRKPFNLVFYVHWWEPKSERMCRAASPRTSARQGVDSDGGYIEFYSMKDALAYIKEEQTLPSDEGQPDNLAWRRSLCFAVVADLRFTARIVRPVSSQRKPRRKNKSTSPAKGRK
jgi:hypothetical protein